MAKDEFEDIIDDEEYENSDDENEDELSEELFEDKLTKDKEGHAKFKVVNHSERALANGVSSDGEVAIYANYALEYFDYRCALSGEKFVIFDEPVKREKNKITTNLSAEHIVALVTGGNDIIPNIVPSVLQYNIQKNGYYILDWWSKARDIEGNPIYTPEKLLKLTNFMLKSLQIRKELGIKPSKREYRKRLMAPNEIDEYLAQEGVAEKLISDTITATQNDVDGKKILTKIPGKEGDIPSLAKQKEKDTKITESMFLVDAIEKLERENIPQEIIQKLKQMYLEVEGEIPFEIEVRQQILAVIEENGIEENKYTVANDILINSWVLENLKDKNLRDSAEVRKFIQDYFASKMEELKSAFSEEIMWQIVNYRPEVIYNQEARQDEQVMIELYKKYSGESEVDFNLLCRTYLRNMLKIKEWMENQKVKTKPPRGQYKDKDGKKTVPEEEATLGRALSSIRQNLIKPYEQLETEEEKEKEEYKRQHPEYEEVKAWIDELDRNNVPIKEEQENYINMLKIKEWMEKKKTTKPPRAQKRDKNGNKTVPEEEEKIGSALNTIRYFLIDRYEILTTDEEREEFKRQHPEYEEVKTWIDELDKNKVPIKEEQAHYINMLKIKEWMEKQVIKTKPPRVQTRNKTVPEEEAKLGRALSSIRQNLIKPYEQLETEEEEYKRTHPEYEEVKAWLEELDRNNLPIKEEQANYINMLKIKEWMEKNKTTKPPRAQKRDKNGNITVPEEEAKIGSALNTIRYFLINRYEILTTDEEREKFKRQHPEYEEVKAWIDELDRNNPQNKTKKIISKKKQEGTLDETMESGAILESEIARIEKSVDERSTIDGETK